MVKKLWDSDSIHDNLIALPESAAGAAKTGFARHQTSHQAYTDWYRARLDEMLATGNGITDPVARKAWLQQKANELRGINNYLKAALSQYRPAGLAKL